MLARQALYVLRRHGPSSLKWNIINLETFDTQMQYSGLILFMIQIRGTEVL